VGGLALYDEKNRLSRTAALRLYTEGSSWFSGDEGQKGRIAAGQLADLAVLSADYFTVPEQEIRNIEAVLTIMGGKIVHASGDFAPLAPPLPPASPDWSPTKAYGGAYRPVGMVEASKRPEVSAHGRVPLHRHSRRISGRNWRGLGCDCFAF